MYRKLWLNGWIVVSAIIVVGSMGCSTYKGIKPIYPTHKGMVSSLQPILRWEAISDTNATYDIVIYERAGEQHTEGTSGVEWDRKKVYYRENIQGTSHKVEIPLKPNTTYLWSLRARKGENISKWSKLQIEVFTGISYHRRSRLFEFKSPPE